MKYCEECGQSLRQIDYQFCAECQMAHDVEFFERSFEETTLQEDLDYLRRQDDEEEKYFRSLMYPDYVDKAEWQYMDDIALSELGAPPWEGDPYEGQ